ncbi:hypothetical protein [Lentzea atacamensis]|uniref:hypothetical protein n=1 Tax=Lentzea atacamensis TaxID=531938 RepID=UPI0011B814C4|nr:hypothetical protein [Lentzea atacamensis]
MPAPAVPAEASSGEFLLWQNGTPIAVNAPVSTQHYLLGANGSGELIGYDFATRTPLVYRDGTLQTLPVPDGTSASPDGTNESGDIVGTAFSSTAWPRSQPGTFKIVADDVALGIDDAGRVVNPDGTRADPRKLAEPHHPPGPGQPGARREVRRPHRYVAVGPRHRRGRAEVRDERPASPSVSTRPASRPRGRTTTTTAGSP